MSTSPIDLRNLDVAELRRAVGLYLERAYGAGPIPEVVRRRLDWPAEIEASTLLSRPPFERANKPGEGGSPVYALRLGNARYPHMKLQVQPWPTSTGYMLSVNTHDQVLGLDPNAEDADAFRALQAENQRIKESIEQAWDQAGLPTFLRYLRDYLDAHPTPGANASETD